MAKIQEVEGEVSKIDQIRLILHGYVETPRGVYINCRVHGIGEGYIHGYRETISCRKCLKELIEAREVIAV